MLIAEDVEDLALRIEGHLRIGTLLLNVGAFALAEQELLRCSSLAGEMGSRRDEARATCWLGIVKYSRGEREEANDSRSGRTSGSAVRLTRISSCRIFAHSPSTPWQTTIPS